MCVFAALAIGWSVEFRARARNKFDTPAQVSIVLLLFALGSFSHPFIQSNNNYTNASS